MDFETEDKQMREVFENFRRKKPPAALLKNFETDVMRDIRAAQNRPWLTLSAAVSLAAVGIFVAVFLFVIQPTGRRVPESEPEAPALIDLPVMREPVQALPVPPAALPAVPAESGPEAEVLPPAPSAETAAEETPAAVPAVEADSEAVQRQLADDLFILEMLGEDAGVLDDASRLAGDLEFVTQLSPTV